MSGQQLEFNYVGDKLGLPAQECYNVMQDSKGYLWISTEAGLCRYNGVNSIIFNKANGLSDNDCYSVIENKDKTIWVLTSSNRIFKIKDKLIEEAPFSKNYACGLDGGLKQGYSMNFINDSLIINTQSSTLSIALNTCKIKAILPPKALSYNFQKVNNTLLCYKSVYNIIMTGQEASKA